MSAAKRIPFSQCRFIVFSLRCSDNCPEQSSQLIRHVRGWAVTSIPDELMIRPQPNPHVLALLSSFGPLASKEASIPILISTPSNFNSPVAYHCFLLRHF